MFVTWYRGRSTLTAPRPGRQRRIHTTYKQLPAAHPRSASNPNWPKASILSGGSKSGPPPPSAAPLPSWPGPCTATRRPPTRCNELPRTGRRYQHGQRHRPAGPRTLGTRRSLRQKRPRPGRTDPRSRIPDELILHPLKPGRKADQPKPSSRHPRKPARSGTMNYDVNEVMNMSYLMRPEHALWTGRLAPATPNPTTDNTAAATCPKAPSPTSCPPTARECSPY